MPTETAALLPLADECEWAGVEEEIQRIFDAAQALRRAGLIADADSAAICTVLDDVLYRGRPRSCLLGAAMMLKLKLEGLHWTAGDELGSDTAADKRPWVNLWRGHKHLCTGRGVTPVLAFTAAWLRGHHAAAADDGEAGDV